MAESVPNMDDKTTAEIRRFRIEIPEAVLGDLRERLARTRFPDVKPSIRHGFSGALCPSRRAVEPILVALPEEERNG
jgi:hypothetical protein